MTRIAMALLFATLVFVGCGDDGAGSGPTVVMDAGAEIQPSGDATAAAPLQPIWGPDSQRLEVFCSGFGSGVSRFAADRAQLTPAQLQAAAGLRARQSGHDTVCYLDGTACFVDVVAADGVRTRSRAPIDIECDDSYQLITRASFKALYDQLACRPISGATTAPTEPHAHCGRGLFGPARMETWVKVPAPGAYAFELDACALPSLPRPVRMRLLDEAGTVLVEGSAPADPGERKICQQLVHTFAQPGRFRLTFDDATESALWAMTLRFAPAGTAP